ncbi:conserved hypothetical protein [Rubrivivax sp. A210]|uniref:hypothetical protein n=1 Tax=Rubrivivax sp. A210 TaxID=2772301 RepID=UPI00191B1886|nr:hypothetical protein [Rubrivivax sp. A210]CAD5375173.1 conserved hypothetical protein [Rubrivivax sp. A210]
MFASSSRPVVFDPYRGRGKRRRIPRWLLLLLLGLAAGAAGVIYLQERVLPPRLSTGESQQLREDHAQAVADRRRLQAELGTATQAMQALKRERDALLTGAAAGRAAAERLNADLAFALDALPPDPREGQVAVRAARLAAQRGSLEYSVALSHERRGALQGVMQLVVTGSAGAGAGERALELPPVKLALDRQGVVRGSLPLPEGFTPRQATVRVLERAGGGQLGMRVLHVN